MGLELNRLRLYIAGSDKPTLGARVAIGWVDGQRGTGVQHAVLIAGVPCETEAWFTAIAYLCVARRRRRERAIESPRARSRCTPTAILSDKIFVCLFLSSTRTHDSPLLSSSAARFDIHTPPCLGDRAP